MFIRDLVFAYTRAACIYFDLCQVAVTLVESGFKSRIVIDMVEMHSKCILCWLDGVATQRNVFGF